MGGNDVGDDLCYAKVAVMEEGTEVEALDCFLADGTPCCFFSVEQFTPDRIQDMGLGG